MLTTKQFINKVNELECFVADVSEKCGVNNVVVVYSKNQVTESIHKVVAIGDIVHFYDCYLLNNFEDIKLLNLITEYVNTPPSEKTAEDKYYIYWVDFDGTMYFLDDNCLKTHYYGNNSEFNSVLHLVETEGEDVYHYQFTESDIKKLPSRWIPSKFGGIGFTKEISVN